VLHYDEITILAVPPSMNLAVVSMDCTLS